jgi:hypothetical protein
LDDLSRSEDDLEENQIYKEGKSSSSSDEDDEEDENKGYNRSGKATSEIDEDWDDLTSINSKNFNRKHSKIGGKLVRCKSGT